MICEKQNQESLQREDKNPFEGFIWASFGNPISSLIPKNLRLLDSFCG
jgi:hypothetical protein